MPRTPSNLIATKFVEARVNGGMITSIDAADIPPAAFQRVKNARVRYDTTRRRPGHSLHTPAKPDANRVLKIATLRDNHGNAYTFRFTPSGIQRRNAGSWTALAAGVGGVLTGGNNDRFKTVVINNRFVFANNGANLLQEIDPIGLTYKRLSGVAATVFYKFITGFAGRVVGAYRSDSLGNEAVEVGWSGNNAITQWDGTVDPSAGSTPLVESPSDFADHISGVFGLSNVLLVLREHSLWVATRNPVASNPFNFYNAVPGIGSDSPYAATAWERGLIWFDRRTNTVWAYELGTQNPEAIGRPIDNQFPRNIDDPKSIFASYRSIENEYVVCIPAVGSTLVRVYTYNFRTKAWSYDEIDNICSTDDADISAGYVAIDDLLGTMDTLTGTMDGLSPAADVVPVTIYGKTDGNMIQEDQDATDDAGTAFTTEMISKNFEMTEEMELIASVRIEYIAKAACTLKLYHAKDGREVDLTGTVDKTVTETELGRTKLLQFNKLIRCRQFTFGLTITGGRCDIVKFVIDAYPSAEARQ